ncbi:MAG: endolytic transglycosylase MltG [Proteobacteria bacterium]|nr:endolytic transglycosylase MltG [Pseudomonadota bacterium]
MVRTKLIVFFAFVILLISLGSFYCLRFIHYPLNNSNETVTYTLIPGTSSSKVLKQLKGEKVLNPLQAKMLGWFIYFKGCEKKLKAGEYQIPLNISAQQLLDKFIRGDVIQYTFTIVEGSTFAQVLTSISTNPKIVQTLQNKSTQEIMILLGAQNLLPEGQFFPETYFYTANTQDIQLLARAYHLMQKNLQSAWDARARDIPIRSPYEALILASIIEKEAMVDEERNQISGVLQRRLSQNMLLQTDPTVIYGLQEQYDGALKREQLRQDTPYNTYVHKGLPPTPIAMPGMKAIMAALHPQHGETLYFVAKGDGTHYFSVTLAEHHEAVKRYQLKLSKPIKTAPRIQKVLSPIKPLYQIGDGI